MRVLFVSEPLFPVGGTSSRTINFAKALVKRGHEVYIITPREVASPHRTIQGVHIRRLKTFMPQSFGTERRKNFLKFLTRGGLLQIMSKIIKLYDPNKPTVIHYVNYYMSICGVLLERFIRIKSIHDLQASAVLESRGIIDKIFRSYIEKISCRASNIIVITDELRNYFVERYPSCKEKIRVVPPSIDVNLFASNKDNDIRRKLDLQNKFKYLLVFHGSPYPENIKALRMLKKVVEKLNEEGLDSRALILGFVSKYVTSPYFISCGYVEDLPSYISAADLAVLPFESRSMGIRTRILEYMSCGVPVIALYDGISGFVEAMGKKAIIATRDMDEIITLYSTILLDSSLRKKVAENAMEYIVKNHSPKAIAIQLESVYNEVLGN